MQHAPTPDHELTCPVRVRRSTGHASTPFTRASEMQRCGRPAAFKIVDEDGTRYDWACRAHVSHLEAVCPDSLTITPTEDAK